MPAGSACYAVPLKSSKPNSSGPWGGYEGHHKCAFWMGTCGFSDVQLSGKAGSMLQSQTLAGGRMRRVEHGAKQSELGNFPVPSDTLQYLCIPDMTC